MDQLRISRGSAELKEVLLKGRYHDQSGWVATGEINQEVTFVRTSPEKVSNLYRWFKAIRAISLTATLMPATATVLLCLSLDLIVNWVVLIPALMAMLFLQVSVNIFNDVEDYLKLIDVPGALGGSGVIQAGWLTTQQMKTAAWGSFILAALLALPAFIFAPSIIFMCAVLAGLGVLGYSSWPFGFKYRALGDVFVFLLCGPVLTVGVSLAATGHIADHTMLLGVMFGLLGNTILNANNINDIELDKQAGAITLAGLIGFKAAVFLQTGFYLGVMGCILALAISIDYYAALPLIACLLVAKHLKTLSDAKSCEDPVLNEIRFDAAKLHLLISALTCVGLFIIWI